MHMILQAALDARAHNPKGDQLHDALAQVADHLDAHTRQIAWSIATAMRYPAVREAVTTLMARQERSIYTVPMQGRDQLVMEIQTLRFHGYARQTVYAITYLSYEGEDDGSPCYHTNGTEYFRLDDREQAELAFRERMRLNIEKGMFFGTSSYERQHDDVFIKTA